MASTNDADMWTIRAALEWTQGYLERKGDENPRISAQWLMSEACGLSRIELYANFERPLSMDERDTLRGYVTRRGRGEPLQYITGEVGFRHITVQVRPGVLIPRPETEVLVSEALALLPAAPRFHVEDDEPDEQLDDTEGTATGQPESHENVSRETFSSATEEHDVDSFAAAGSVQVKPDEVFLSTEGVETGDLSEEVCESLLIADICTGSGCIACSIAHEHPNAHLIATDIAPEAVALARDNIATLGLEDRIQVIEGDLGQNIPDDLMGAFDLVVSNPPYVPTDELAEAPREVVDFEPALALDGGSDGLDVVRRMLPWCARALKPGGGLALELYETHCDEAADLVRKAGFTDVHVVCDLAGRPRVVVAKREGATADQVSD